MTKDNQFLRIALPTPLRRLFDYLPPQDVDNKSLIPGIRVQVPFQSRTLIGVLIEVVKKSDVPYEKLKKATAVLDQQPILTDDVYKLCLWAAAYYHYSLGEVLASAMPTLLRKGKSSVSSVRPEEARPSRQRFALPQGERCDVSKDARMTSGNDTALTLNPEQDLAVQTICQAKNDFSIFLLDGITGSGKTEVYMQVMNAILAEGKQVLVLVPEISLTPQTIERFRSRFAEPIAALHSAMTDKERLAAWQLAKESKVRIVIGTRSAVFTPFSQLGLIIVDEEHDGSFKQQDRFRYHARDMAIMRANMNQIPIVLGSATPSLESLLNAKRGRYQHLLLSKRAGVAKLPDYELIDLRNTSTDEGISTTLLNAMQHELTKGNQVMLFLNRRGFAPVLFCTKCAWICQCKRCDARMVYHRSPPRLHCHHCDTKNSIPSVCQQCGEATLQPIGFGTQRLEETLAKQFPHIPLIRVDRDSTKRKGAMDALLAEIHQQKTAILLGTQMLAKGHHFPNVTLVGVVDADTGLFSADFRAVEHLGQLLLQVAGRAGRAEKPGRVLIQTRYPDHPLLQLLVNNGYDAFAQHLLQEREQTLLPPYSYFAVFRAEAYAEQETETFLTAIKEWCEQHAAVITTFGPVPALLAKRKGLHCKHLLLKSAKRGLLQQCLQYVLSKIEALPKNTPVKWILDVDPVEVI